eukprot:CAMPEP_0201568480 /NCGR_PEP_ID=MMETSP0190_2-20130828/9584_1 /ASSEMBLY_ACC=CAM_ASM_000263 /TAXON_ID=37353 /ORGANISM="Rosalina sp." /LENGTH=699 /DNA_ID=CAMNT_0047989647 /DNA_START=29 /DNA_END=2125 /DNA_ORIENTATION=-
MAICSILVIVKISLTIILATIAITESQSDCLDQMECKSEIGDDSASCSEGYTMVSCGIENKNSEHWVTLGTSMASDKCTIHYKHIPNNPSPDIDDTKPKAHARCCNFTECFGDNFECSLQTKSSRDDLHQQCSNQNGYPHLLGVSLHQIYDNITDNKYDDDYNIFGGFYFSSSSAINDNTFKEAFHKLFNISTDKPTPSPTNTPSIAATTHRPTYANDFKYLQETEGTNRGSLYRFPDAPQEDLDISYNPYFTINTLCCTEKGTSPPSIIPTTNPITASPSQAPTAPSQAPTKYTYADGKFIRFPLEEILDQQDFEFRDTNKGTVTSINWGVSNTIRTYERDPDTGGITKITYKSLNESYFFTIKKYTTYDWEFRSEYGEVYLDDNDGDAVCKFIPEIGDEKQRNIKTIQHIRVFKSDTEVEGMAMWRLNIPDPYICHIGMAEWTKDEQGNYMQHEIDELLREDRNDTIDYDYTECPGDVELCGFSGSITDDNLTIADIQFQFVYPEEYEGDPNCPNTTKTEAPTPSPIPPTFEPSPSPTMSPSETTSSPIPTPKDDQTLSPTLSSTTASPTESNEGTLQCYYIMGNQTASCLNVSDTIGDTELTNPSFMTGCIGYSLTEQPMEWYIQNDTCFVDGNNEQNETEIAAIAICCTLIDPPEEEQKCEDDPQICKICDESFTGIITNYCVIGGISIIVVSVW